MDGTSSGAVGTIDHRTVAEYKSSVEDEYHLVVYDGNTGNVSAGVYNTKNGGIATYVMNASARDGAAVLLAMTPYFLHDEEFKEKFDAYHAERQRGYPDMDEATNLMGVLCDNVYRRVKDPSCSAHLRFTAELSGRLTRIGRASIDAGTFSPTSVIAGEFTMLSYAKFGEIKYGDVPFSDVRIKTVFDLINEIDGAVSTYSAKERFGLVNLILVRYWEYVRDFCERCKEQNRKSEESGESKTMCQSASETLGKLPGSSVIASGITAAVAESGGSGSNNSATAPSRAKTHKDASQDTENSVGNDETANSGIALQDKADGQPKKQEATDEEKGRIPFHHTDEIGEPVGGVFEQNDSYDRMRDARAAEDIEQLLDKMAEKEFCVEEENKRLHELNSTAQSISYGSVHAGVSVRVNRISDVDEELIELYHAIAAPLLVISKQLQRNLLRQLEEKRRGCKQTGLLMGHRLETHAIHRNDGKLFYKNALPNEHTELAVGLLLDESGSMSSRNRCIYARAAAIILYDFCHSLGIPVMIYGHSTGSMRSAGNYGHCVELFSYAEFEEIDKNDKYRLMDIGARGSNRDGAALRFVAEQLVKRPEELKILILVSDGQPADVGYGGTAAEEDLSGIKREYQRKGVLFVAAAIGDDKQNIERIYGDSFLDITDLNQLPAKLTAVVKRHIRV